MRDEWTDINKILDKKSEGHLLHKFPRMVWQFQTHSLSDFPAGIFFSSCGKTHIQQNILQLPNLIEIVHCTTQNIWLF
jgi:hypothetical protein